MNTSEGAPERIWVCAPLKGSSSAGFFYGESPVDFPIPVLLAQLSLAAFLTAVLQRILTPIGESAFVSQMLVGIALGPSFFGKNDNAILDAIFPSSSFYVSETFAFFGCMFFMFMVGVKIDVSVLTKSGKKAIAIGLGAFFVPLILNVIFALFLRSRFSMPPNLNRSLIPIAVFQSSSSFYVIACVLEDLKLLNSELGRLALSSSMISGTLSLVCTVIGLTARQTSLGRRHALAWMAVCFAGMLLFIVFILRPMTLWMVRNTARGKLIKEAYVFWLFVMVLGCALLSELIGQHFMLGPMILGLAVPDGPPLGAALVAKLEPIVSSILLPLYFVFSGARIDLSDLHMNTLGIVQLLSFCSFSGKLIGTMVPSLYCQMPFPDSLSLGLVMSSQGITDILLLQQGIFHLLIDQQSYSMMALTTLLLTATISPIVKLVYNPAKRYRSNKRRRTVEHAAAYAELRLVLCLHHEDSTPAMINLLELTHPTSKNPICFYVVHLMQLAGRSSPLLITHKPGKTNSLHSDFSDHIINAFHLFQRSNSATVIMNAYTSIAPYSTMHDDVCMLALEKRSSIVIIPFHKKRTLHGTEETASPIRVVNRNILSKAPCSVGILVEQGTLTSKSLCRIGVFFIEGPDDREALAYATRMAEHPNVGVSMIRIVYQSEKQSNRVAKRKIDETMIERFEAVCEGANRHVYEEEMVNDSVELINIIKSRKTSYDLILVGRRHDGELPLFVGLTEWNEFPELGFIGDMLASSDSNCEASVLVVQQHSIGGGQEIPDTSRRHSEELFPVVPYSGQSLARDRKSNF